MTNKRAKSEALYAELRVDGYKPPEGKSLRAVFIDRAVMEIGMTEKGAATYYVNAKKRYEGGVVANYYKAKNPPKPQVGEAGAFDSRWSVVKIEDGKVVACYTSPTEEKARKEFYLLRPDNQACCAVVPGVMAVGERVSHVDDEPSSAGLVAAKPEDQEEEE